MSGLYLHIPFCKQACSYCDFYFVTRHKRKDEFVEQLINEIESHRNSRFTQEPVQTIYFGGGTPSLLSPAQVGRILETIADVFSLDLKEVTLEMNPDDVNAEYLRGLRSAGITRASMGVQSFDEDLLRFMHRAHNSTEARSCMEALAETGFDSYTVDLIYGNPGQTSEMLQKDLDILSSYDPPHVSAYTLTIEPKTRLGKQLELGRLLPAEDEVVAAQFSQVEEALLRTGINRYEVSNFAKPGAEAVHNSAYWSHENYLGLGPGAHSFWWEEDGTSARRWSNKPDLSDYLNNKTEFKKYDEDLLDLRTLAEERIMLGLRTVAGISFKTLLEKYSWKPNEKTETYLHTLQKNGKARVEEGGIRLTREGLKISDAIILDLITLNE